MRLRGVGNGNRRSAELTSVADTPLSLCESSSMNAARPASAAHHSTPAILPPAALNPFEQLRYAREVIELEAQAMELVAARLDTEFCRAADLLYLCGGSVIVSGIGKAGLIGQKLTATLSSTGTRAHFLHPAEAIHGDFGRIHRDDTMLILSQSGETEEITRLLPTIAEFGVPIIAMTARRGSTLGKAAAITLELGPLKEACALGLAPTASTAAMLALGDALALVVSRMRSFDRDDFARFHPGGALGRKLAKVEEAMRPLAECRVARCSQTIREIFAMAPLPRRRTGAIMIVDPNGILRGIFTDSDLARLFEARRDQLLDEPIRAAMTKRPRTVPAGAMLTDALEILAERKISELPVVDDAGRPAGLIDITDVFSLFPERTRATTVKLNAGSADSLASSVITSSVPITIETLATSPQPIATHWVTMNGTLTNAAAPLPAQSTTAAKSPAQTGSTAVPRPNFPGFFDPNRTPHHDTAYDS